MKSMSFVLNNVENSIVKTLLSCFGCVVQEIFSQHARIQEIPAEEDEKLFLLAFAQ